MVGSQSAPVLFTVVFQEPVPVTRDKEMLTLCNTLQTSYIADRYTLQIKMQNFMAAPACIAGMSKNSLCQHHLSLRR